MNEKPSIGQSISKCDTDIHSILSKWEAMHNSCDFDLFRGMAENLKKHFGKIIDEFIEKASERVKNGHKTPDCTLKMKQNEHTPDEVLIIDSDDEPEVKARPEMVITSPNDAIAKNNHTPNRSTVHINTEKTGTQSGLKHQQSTEINSANPRQSNSSTSHVKRKEIPSKFQCEVCLKTYKQMDKLIFHRRIHLNDIPFHCRICFRSLATKTERADHEKKCDQKRLECYLCGKNLVNHSALVRHMRIHSGLRPFKCVSCSKRFALKFNMIHHQMHVHKRSTRKR